MANSVRRQLSQATWQAQKCKQRFFDIREYISGRFSYIGAPLFILRAAFGMAAAPGTRMDDNDTPLIHQAYG